MTLHDILRTRRSVRRFQQQPIPRDALERMLDAARLAPSGANKQPLRYVAVTRPDLVSDLFALTRWAAYLPNFAPPEGSRPTAFIAVVFEGGATPELDAGAAIENLILSAWADGIGSCWLGAFDKNKTAALLDIQPPALVQSLIALGYPAHEPQAEPMQGDDVRYHLDENGTLRVPKRALADIVRWLD